MNKRKKYSVISKVDLIAAFFIFLMTTIFYFLSTRFGNAVYQTLASNYTIEYMPGIQTLIKRYIFAFLILLIVHYILNKIRTKSDCE